MEIYENKTINKLNKTHMIRYIHRYVLDKQSSLR